MEHADKPLMLIPNTRPVKEDVGVHTGLENGTTRLFRVGLISSAPPPLTLNISQNGPYVLGDHLIQLEERC